MKPSSLFISLKYLSLINTVRRLSAHSKHDNKENKLVENKFDQTQQENHNGKCMIDQRINMCTHHDSGVIRIKHLHVERLNDSMTPPPQYVKKSMSAIILLTLIISILLLSSTLPRLQSPAQGLRCLSSIPKSLWQRFSEASVWSCTT